MLPPNLPTAADLLNHPMIQAALANAWNGSQTDDPLLRHEEGGWIYMDVMTGQFTIHRAPSGAIHSVDLGNPPHVSGSVIVGTFHTHPNPTAEGWEPGRRVRMINTGRTSQECPG